MTLYYKISNSYFQEFENLVDLNEYKDADQLQALGLERLKQELKSRGLKCGGTLHERAERLFRTKNIQKEDLDASLFPNKN